MIVSYLIILYIISAFNNYNMDYEIYAGTYTSPLKAKHSEILFKYFMNLGKILNLEYQKFLYLLFFVIILFIYFLFKKYKISLYYLILFSIYPFFLNVIQIRHFFAEILFIYFLFSQKQRNRILFLFSSFLTQGAFIIFVPLLFFKSKITKVRKKIIGISFILITTILLTFKNQILLLLANNLNFHYKRKILIYLEASKLRNIIGTRHLYFVIAFFIIISMIYFLNKINIERSKQKIFINYYYYYLLVLPLFLVDSVYSDRFIRILFVSSLYIIGAVENKFEKKKYIFRIYVFLSLLFILIVAFLFKNYADIILIVIRNNELF